MDGRVNTFPANPFTPQCPTLASRFSLVALGRPFYFKLSVVLLYFNTSDEMPTAISSYTWS
jgi:hypothetical protein